MGVFSDNPLIDIVYWVVIMLSMVGVSFLTYKLTVKPQVPVQTSKTELEPLHIDPSVPGTHPYIPTPKPSPQPHPNPVPNPTPPKPISQFVPVITLTKAKNNDQQGQINIEYSIKSNTPIPPNSSMAIWFNVFANGVQLSTSNDVLQVPLSQNMLDGRRLTTSADTFSYGNVLKGANVTVEAQVHNNFKGDVTYAIGNKAVITVE